MLNCKQCLLRELDNEELWQRVRRTIAAIPEADRCSCEEYERRLTACRQCGRLLSGVCRVCGCFVEVRAAGRDNHCPAPGGKLW